MAPIPKLSEGEKCLVRRLHGEFCAQGIPNPTKRTLQLIDRKVGARTLNRVIKGPSPKETAQIGRRSILNDRNLRFLARKVAQANLNNNAVSAKTLMVALDRPCSASTVRRALKKMPCIALRSLRRRFKNEKPQRKQRLAWASEHCNEDWLSCSFYDEKRFCLDGPDGVRPQWRDTRLPERPPLARHSGGGSVMLQLIIDKDGVRDFDVVEGAVTKEVVHDFLAGALHCGDALMMDNARPHLHSAKILPKQGVSIVPQPAYSPDLQPVENIFAKVASLVYGSGRQYFSRAALCLAISKALQQWSEQGADKELCGTVVASMPRRVMELQRLRGGRLCS